jgi:FAD/FMN-containing dehydrogenase
MATQAVEPAGGVADAAVAGLRARLRGELVVPGDRAYDEARRLFNAMIDKRPAAIARCAGVADVISAVDFARAHEFEVSVRGGGHNVTGNALCDGGVVIDLSPMKGVWVDPEARIARVQGGLTWAEVNHDLQAFDLAAAGGFVGTTGVGGLTLGGGLGWLVRKHGLALDNLRSVDLVTAEGRLLTVSEQENPDLFWGVRGGGGNFGIATSFEFDVHPAGIVFAGVVIHPLARAGEAIRFWRDFGHTAPEDFTSAALLLTAPPAPFVPPEAQGAPVVGIGGVYTAPLEEAEAALRPLREFGPPLVDIFQPMPYSAAQTFIDFLWPPGYLNYWKSSFLHELTDDAIETLVDNFARVPSPLTSVIVEHNGDGALERVPAEATAFAHRTYPHNLLIPSLWSDAADSEQNIAWTRALFDAMQPYRPDAVYVNYLDNEGAERIRDAYGNQTYERLVALKNTYDPTNFFNLNQNILPSA